MQDLYSLQAPHAKKFSKKNEIHPFDDAGSLEFFSEKNDASFLVFGASTKKHPHSMTIARTFSHKVLDMLELHLDPATHVPMPHFKIESKPAYGLRPMLVFAGAAFENPVADEYTLAKSLLLDMFKGEVADQVDVEGLRYVILVAAGDGTTMSTGDAASKPPIHVRAYMIRTKRSGQRLPRVEVEEMGPRMDLRVGRSRQADDNVLKEAMRRPRGTEEKTKKNIHLDPMGDKIGRVHMGTQDLGKLQTRKMKGLKRSRDALVDKTAGAEGGGDGEDVEMNGGETSSSKRKRV
jgi:ribosome production factor 2